MEALTGAYHFPLNLFLAYHEKFSNVFRWQILVCLMLAWILVYFCIWKGVKSVGKVVYVTATFPYLVLFILMIRGATLEGSLEGVVYFLNPDFTKLVQPQVRVLFIDLLCCFVPKKSQKKSKYCTPFEGVIYSRLTDSGISFIT